MKYNIHTHTHTKKTGAFFRFSHLIISINGPNYLSAALFSSGSYLSVNSVSSVRRGEDQLSCVIRRSLAVLFCVVTTTDVPARPSSHTGVVQPKPQNMIYRSVPESLVGEISVNIVCSAFSCSITFVEVLGQLAGVSAAVGAALFHSRTLAVLLAALHAGRREAAGLLRRGTVALLHSLHRLQELTAGETLVVLLGKEGLRRTRGGGEGRGGDKYKSDFLSTCRRAAE